MLWQDNLRYHGDEQLMAVLLELDDVKLPVVAKGDLVEKWEDLAIGTLTCEVEFVSRPSRTESQLQVNGKRIKRQSSSSDQQPSLRGITLQASGPHDDASLYMEAS